MSEEKNVVYMNMEILNIIHLVLDYSRFIKSENLVKKEKDFDWYKKTKEYYEKLELPKGMKHDKFNLDKILDFKNQKKFLDEMDCTEESSLSNFIWIKN